MIGIRDFDLEFSHRIVPARTAARKNSIVVRPFSPVVPNSGMQQNQPFARIHKFCQRLAQRLSWKSGLVDAENRNLRMRQFACRDLRILGVIDRIPSGFEQR